MCARTHYCSISSKRSRRSARWVPRAIRHGCKCARRVRGSPLSRHHAVDRIEFGICRNCSRPTTGFCPSVTLQKKAACVGSCSRQSRVRESGEIPSRAAVSRRGLALLRLGVVCCGLHTSPQVQVAQQPGCRMRLSYVHMRTVHLLMRVMVISVGGEVGVGGSKEVLLHVAGGTPRSHASARPPRALWSAVVCDATSRRAAGAGTVAVAVFFDARLIHACLWWRRRAVRCLRQDGIHCRTSAREQVPIPQRLPEVRNVWQEALWLRLVDH